MRIYWTCFDRRVVVVCRLGGWVDRDGVVVSCWTFGDIISGLVDYDKLVVDGERWSAPVRTTTNL